MSDRKLMQQALEALENPWKAGPDGVANAITALRERLAQPEQDQKPPVKTYCGGKPNYCTPEQEAKMLLIGEDTAELVLEALENVTKDYVENRQRTHNRAIEQLYKVFTQKSQRREWASLTEEEIMEPWPFENKVAFARWLETKLKEKNT